MNDTQLALSLDAAEPIDLHAEARETVRRAIEAIPAERACACGDALNGALITAQQLVPIATRRRLAPIVERYWGAQP